MQDTRGPMFFVQAVLCFLKIIVFKDVLSRFTI